MSKLKLLIISLIAIGIAIWIFGCSDSGTGPVSGTSKLSAGSKININSGGISFNMVYVPAKKTFVGNGDTISVTVTRPFLIGETEVTYALWNIVYTWATDTSRGSNRYYFQNVGRIGSGNSGSILQPVTYVSWRDAMVWCNALTEWYKAMTADTNFKCVYKYSGDILRDSRNTNATACDNATMDSVIGFRLPLENEWELAARYKVDRNNDGDIQDSAEFYPWNFASGAYTYNNDTADVNPKNGIVDGKDANDAVAVYGYYWDGTSWVATGVISTAPAKSKNPNSLGIYDMSGNVFELCSDIVTRSTRAGRGGWYSSYSYTINVAYYTTYNTTSSGPGVGFRVACSQ